MRGRDGKGEKGFRRDVEVVIPNRVAGRAGGLQDDE